MKSTAPIKNNISANSGSALRYGMFISLAFMIASVITCCFSYSNAKQNIANDLNNAMIALAHENRDLWTRPDTIAAIRHLHETTHKPLLYQASDVNFRNPMLKDEAYFTLELINTNNGLHRIGGNKIASDSIIIMPERVADGLAIQVQGFADCSMASIFYASDQTIPGILFSFAILSMASMFIWKKKEPETPETEFIAVSASPSLDGIKLTPMQRQLTQMLLEAPGMKVDKRTLCESLWGNKSNAEESLYTLVKRTKSALAEANMEIVCNRGDSYELRINA
ncbi:MAG: helix-turn-helix domain-containing protein [Barnesiella sp.]|nr:helix-turn-helix domain-containing protein [Barnesiella sp.]MBD5258850.1 helix-turn-helix domain-containing protein [Barnesiella sp.]